MTPSRLNQPMSANGTPGSSMRSGTPEYATSTVKPTPAGTGTVGWVISSVRSRENSAAIPSTFTALTSRPDRSR